MKFKSIATWPKDAGIDENTSTDTHDTLAQAEAVCSMFDKNGLGGDRRIFPVSTDIEVVLTKTFSLGMDVIVHPNPDSIATHEFQGTIKRFKMDTDGSLIIRVEDQEENLIDCSVDEVEIPEE